MQSLLAQLKIDFPDLTFSRGKVFCWSPHDKRVSYKLPGTEVDIWSLLHEVGHAVCGHTSYQTDFTLIKLEAAAWNEAEALAKKYGYKIDNDHIQDCLDTYRDWLHRRSTCPVCGTRSLQKTPETYQCFNCSTMWKVTASRFCRPYRKLAAENKKPHGRDRHATFV